MARKLEVFIKQLTKNWFLYSLILLLALTIMVDYRFTDNISHKLGDLFYVLPLASLVLAALPLLHEWKLFRHKYMVLVMAYVVAGLFLVYLTGIFGPYFQILTLLLFASTFWYDWPGLLLSLSAALVILVLAVWYQFDNLSEQLFYIALIHYLTLLIIGILFERVSLRHRLRRSADTAELLQTVSFERTRLLSLINSMADAVMATDSDGKILLYNGAVLDLLNTNVSLENKLLQQFLALKDQQAKAVDVIKLAQQARTVLKRDDLYFISNENQKVRVYLSISPIHSSYGRLGNGGFIMVLRDITKEKSLDEERTEFISVTSHELKTPIAIAEANLSTALLPQLSEAVPANVRDLLEQAHNQIVFLGDLINDLTTLAKAERGDLGIDIEPIDPHALLKRLTEDYAAEVKAKGLELVIAHSQAPPVLTSELYVHEILQNFISNAIKYTQHGSITLSAVAAEKGGVRFSVKDTGIGLSATDKKKIFQKFYRSEDFRTRKTRGTGLGLYITVKLAERINGKIWFDSQLNQGSTFYLEVPPIGARRQDQSQIAKQEIKEVVKAI